MIMDKIIPKGKHITCTICGYVTDKELKSLYQEYKEKYKDYKITHKFNNNICTFTIANES